MRIDARAVRGVAKAAVSNWAGHGAMTQAAALAFYTVFSLAPVLLIVISVAGAVFGEDAVRGRILEQFQELIGRGAASAVQSIIQRARIEGTGLSGAVGVFTLIASATVVFAQLQSSLNAIWEVQPKEGRFIRRFLKKRLMSFALVLAIGFLLLVSLALSAGLKGFQGFVENRLGLPAGWLDLAGSVLTFAIAALLFALIYRYLPDARIAWRNVLFGAVVTALLFSIGKWAIGLYIGRSAVASPYGAAGSIILILVWVYYASTILLLGAEFTRAWSHLVLGQESVPEPGAMRRPRARVNAGGQSRD
jgi:membrane protein